MSDTASLDEIVGCLKFLGAKIDVPQLKATLDNAGMVIVPKEPTREMWAAGGDSIVQSPYARRIGLHHDEVIKLVWYPMIGICK